MAYHAYVERNPDVMMGKPIIKGSRITVELIMRKLADGYSFHDLINSYPHLDNEKIYAALEYAADIIANEEILEVA